MPHGSLTQRVPDDLEAPIASRRMTLKDDVEFVAELLDAYAADAWRMGVVAEDPEDGGVPFAMQVGNVNDDGWVEWRVLPSTVSEEDVSTLETEFEVRFPPLFRAYLLARFHLFDQVRSRRYDHQILMTDTPAGKPLQPIRQHISAWEPLISAGFVPFAEWGDGYGPMCFDSANRAVEGECPVVWLDHERLVSLGAEKCRHREHVAPMAQPLYDSCRDFLVDVFGRD